MSSKRITFAYCNACGQRTRHQLVATRNWQQVEIEGDDNSPPVYLQYTYDFLQCCGCDCVTMRRTTKCPELWDVGHTETEYFPPAASRRHPHWDYQLPYPVIQLLREVYLALHSDSRRLAIMGARTLVDIAILDKVGDRGTFEQKLKALEGEGFIGKRNREVLAAALGAGNAAAHRGHDYKALEVNQVIDIVENLLQAIYVLEKAAENLKKVTPPRKQVPK